MPAIALHGICKTYDNGKVKAVSDVSFDVSRGELFGLIGPDGAGKTSIFRILTTLLFLQAVKHLPEFFPGNDINTRCRFIQK